MKSCPNCGYNYKDTQLFCEECQPSFYRGTKKIKDEDGLSIFIASIGSFVLGIILVSRFPRKSPEFMLGLMSLCFGIAFFVNWFEEQSEYEKGPIMNAIEKIFWILSIIFMFIALIFQCSSN